MVLRNVPNGKSEKNEWEKLAVEILKVLQQINRQMIDILVVLLDVFSIGILFFSPFMCTVSEYGKFQVGNDLIRNQWHSIVHKL